MRLVRLPEHRPYTNPWLVSLGLGGYGFLCVSCEAVERMTIPYYGYIIEEEGDARFIEFFCDIN